jgi:hypothetical protein
MHGNPRFHPRPLTVTSSNVAWDGWNDARNACHGAWDGPYLFFGTSFSTSKWKNKWLTYHFFYRTTTQIIVMPEPQHDTIQPQREHRI